MQDTALGKRLEASQCYNGEICEYLVLPYSLSKRLFAYAALSDSLNQCVSSSSLSVPELHRISP
jgi:hypothetical protein